MRLRAPHSSFPTGDARRVATLDPSAASAGASRTAIPRAALGLFIALSLAACTVIPWILALQWGIPAAFTRSPAPARWHRPVS